MDFNTIKKISPFQLTPGMILAEDININSIKLVNKDTELTERIIEGIQNFHSLPYVKVYQRMEDSDIEILQKRASNKFKQTEVSFAKFSDGAEKIFNEVITNSKVEIKSIRTLSENILTELQDVGVIIKNIIDSRNPDCYIFRHSVNVATLASMLAKWDGMSSRDIMLITYAGILHDIGKSKISASILNKSDKLTKKEFEVIQTHPILGYEIVKTIPYIDPAVEMAVLMHHERMDGSGYPLKLKEEKIHSYAKIIAIADVFDAMTSNRAYNKKQSPLLSLKTLQEESFGKLDLRLTDLFIRKMSDYYIGEYAVLSNGQKGKILKIDINNITSPLVMVGDTIINLAENPNFTVVDIL